METIASINIPFTSFSMTSAMGICLYWIPFFLCFVGYIVRTAHNYITDRRTRSEKESKGLIYYPTDKIGDIIGRAIVTILPIANIWGAMFDIAPIMFKRFFTWISDIFNQPLVPRREKK